MSRLNVFFLSSLSLIFLQSETARWLLLKSARAGRNSWLFKGERGGGGRGGKKRETPMKFKDKCDWLIHRGLPLFIYSNSMQISLYHSNSIQSIMFLTIFFLTPTCFKKLNSKARLLNWLEYPRQGRRTKSVVPTF
jgi:hypothetical protein